MSQETKYPEPIAGALIRNRNGKLLFCRSGKWKNKYTVFGGHIEMGETMEKALVREVKEETGLDVKMVAKLGTSDSIFDPGFHTKKHFVFLDYLCEYDGEEDDIQINGEFKNDYKWLTVEEAEKIDLAGGAKLMLEEYKKYLQDENALNGWKRCQADFENYKKRQAKNSIEMIRFANEGLVLQIIPVLDNFNASLAHVPSEQKDNAWVTGITYIKKQLEDILKNNGVDEIEVKVGDNFNPNLHEAVQSADIEDKADGADKISKVVQNGYKIDGKLIRPARVVVE